MRKLGLAGFMGAAIAAVSVIHTAPLPSAGAAPCPDAELVFARGTTEQPGLGPTGDAFLDSLRSRIGAKSLGVYAVDYPAAMDFATAVDGIFDARAHILATAANCPKTKMVLGGFSQGAAVMGFVTANIVPDGVAQDVPAPMPPDVADHVAAVALLGTPSPRFMKAINDLSIVIGPRYMAKTIELCVDNDLVCDPEGRSFSAHNEYTDSGKVDEGAAYVASKLQASWAADEAAAATATSTAAPAPPTPSTPAPSLLSAPVAGSPPSAHLGTAAQALPGPPPLPGPAAAAAPPGSTT